MRHFAKIMLVFLAVISVAVLLNSKAFADGGYGERTQTGEPPYGMAIQGDATGERLTGELSIEAYDYNATTRYARVLRVVTRLSHGNDMNTFSTELDCTDPYLSQCCQSFQFQPNPKKPPITIWLFNTLLAECIQAAVINAMGAPIVSYFFPNDTNQTVVLKFINEYGYVVQEGTSANGFLPSVRSLSDIELAVK